VYRSGTTSKSTKGRAHLTKGKKAPSENDETGGDADRWVYVQRKIPASTHEKGITAMHRRSDPYQREKSIILRETFLKEGIWRKN